MGYELETKHWIAGNIVFLVAALVLGLFLVWINIQKVDLAYKIRTVQNQVDDSKRLTAKLEVERNSLISSVRLKRLANERGLRPAKPSQVRVVGIE